MAAQFLFVLPQRKTYDTSGEFHARYYYNKLGRKIKGVEGFISAIKIKRFLWYTLYNRLTVIKKRGEANG